MRYFEQFPGVKPFGHRGSFHNKAEWIVDLTTRADREGKHAEYANRYDASDLKAANLKELDLQLDRGYRVSRRRPTPVLLPVAAKYSELFHPTRCPTVITVLGSDVPIVSHA